MKTFKILGLLLTYPEGSVIAAGSEILSILNGEALLPDEHIQKIKHFLDGQHHRDLFEVQEEYVDLFDRGRAHCLHLFEHIHGESRDRGQAMVNLIDTYKTQGLEINCGELPDYLPVFMEYLSYCDPSQASQLLGETVDIISLIGEKLRKRDAPYAVIFAAIEALSVVKPDRLAVAAALEHSPKDPETLDELDEQWQEAEAFSGDPVADCKTCNAFPNAMSALEKQVGGLIK